MSLDDKFIARPGPSAPPIYVALHDTALNFINAQRCDSGGPKGMDFDLLRSYCIPSFQHSWGHNYAVSTNPPLQGTKSLNDFVAHLKLMLPKLQSWTADVVEMTVDPVKMKVAMRISFWMLAKGAEADNAVENDLLWILEMEEVGDGQVGIRKSMEFMDGAAAGRLKEIMMAIM